jgi:hypothetical protein
LHRGGRSSRRILTRFVNRVVVSSRDKVSSMAEPFEIITAAEMDTMTPQQRADAVDASIVHCWDEVDPAFRRKVEQRAAELAKTLGADA